MHKNVTHKLLIKRFVSNAIMLLSLKNVKTQFSRVVTTPDPTLQVRPGEYIGAHIIDE